MIDVLVVDDDVRVAEVNAAYVGKVPGFRVAAKAHSAAEALRRRGAPVDLVLLDHYLPDETGLRSSTHAGAGPRTDVIMVTAARDVATVQAAMRHGALQYLVKPFSFAGLRASLDAYATLRRTLDGRRPRSRPGRGRPDLRRPARRSGTVAPEPAQAATPEPRPSWSAGVLTGAEGPLSAQELADRTGLSRSDGPALSEAPGAAGPRPAQPQVRRHGPPGTPLRVVAS